MVSYYVYYAVISHIKGIYMKRIRLILALIALVMIVIIVVIVYKPNNITKNDAFDRMISELEQKGFTLEIKDVKKDILAGERKYITVNQQENIQAYIYDNNKEMEKDAGYINPNGYGYSKKYHAVCVDWVAPPHFYKMDNIIVLYCGENDDIIYGLKEIMGDQFAGSIN